VSTHAISIQPGLPMRRDMSAETMKIPEPIITEITTSVESNRPRPCTNCCSGCFAAMGWLIF
jgi:hypothetical protein